MIDSQSSEKTLLLVTEHGYGKRTSLEAYSIKKRGAKSVKAISASSGKIVSAQIIDDSDELVILNSKGNISRIPTKEIPIQGRTAQGVKIMKLHEKDTVVDVGKIA